MDKTGSYGRDERKRPFDPARQDDQSGKKTGVPSKWLHSSNDLAPNLPGAMANSAWETVRRYHGMESSEKENVASGHDHLRKGVEGEVHLLESQQGTSIN